MLPAVSWNSYFGRDFRPEPDTLHCASLGPVSENLINAEAAFRDGLLERETLAALAEILTRRLNGPGVFFSQGILLVVDYDFTQLHNHCELAWSE